MIKKTTIEVESDTRNKLNQLKYELKCRTHDELVSKLIKIAKRIEPADDFHEKVKSGDDGYEIYGGVK